MNFKRGLAAFGFLASAALASMSASAASGDLDPAFGTGGVTIITSGPLPNSNDGAIAVVRQSTGKVVVVGNAVTLTRLTVTGAVDTTFGTAGRLFINPSPTHPLTAYHAIGQPDDKIVIATTSSGPHALIYRLLPDGAPDATFGTAGVATLDLSADGIAENAIQRIALQPDGKLVLAGGEGNGMLVVRLNANGTRDTAFGTNGHVVTNAGAGIPLTASALALYGDGRIAVGASNRVARLLANGALDTTFPFGSYFVTTGDSVISLATQADGKLLVGMYVYFVGDFIGRYTAAGLLDTDATTGFGNINGPNRLGTTQAPVAPAAMAESGGAIVVAGNYAEICCSNSLLQNQGGVARLMADGSLDASYGSNGIFRSTLPGYSANNAYASWGPAAVDGSGGVVAGAYLGDIVVTRANATGTALAGFGTGGLASVDLLARASLYANAGERQPDGKLLAAGCIAVGPECDTLVVRVNADGSPDTGFGTNGRVVLDLGGNDLAFAVAVQPDGRILVAGRAVTGADYHFYVVRLTAAGALDTTFNTTGKKVFDLEAASTGEARGVALQSTGKIIVAGTVSRASGLDIGVARLNTDGSLDATFGAAGARIVDYSNFGVEDARALVVRADDRIVVAATTGNRDPASSVIALLGLTADGSPDAGFGNAGGFPGWRNSIDAGMPSSLVELPGGMLALGGWTSRTYGYWDPPTDQSWVAMLPAATGTTFSAAPYYGSILGSNSRVNGLARMPDGRIAVAGEIAGASRDAVLTRLMPDGGTDYDFVPTALDVDDLSPDRGGFPVALPDGKIVSVHNVEPDAIVFTQRLGRLMEPTTLVVVADPPAIVFGQAVTLVATISGVSSPPSGQMLFTGGYAGCQVPVVPSTATASTASCTVPNMGAGTYTVTVYYIPSTTDFEAKQGEVSVTVSEVATGIAASAIPATLPAAEPFTITVSARNAAGAEVIPGGTYEVTVEKVSGTGGPVAFYAYACDLLGGQSSSCDLELRWSQAEPGAQFRLRARSLVAGIPDLPPSATLTVDFVKYATGAHASVAGPPSPVAGTSGSYVFVINPGPVLLTQPTGTVSFSVGGVPVAGCGDVAMQYLNQPFAPGSIGATCGAVRRDIAGVSAVSATYPGDGLFEAATASLSIDVQAAAPASIAVAGGGGQSVALGSPIAAPLQAVVRDEFGNGVPARPVSFTVPSSGATLIPFNSGQATTGANGIASLGGIAAGASGAYTVTASTPGVAGTISFPVTNTAAAPAVFLTSSNNPSVLGAPIGFTATVMASGEPGPSGQRDVPRRRDGTGHGYALPGEFRGHARGLVAPGGCLHDHGAIRRRGLGNGHVQPGRADGEPGLGRRFREFQRQPVDLWRVRHLHRFGRGHVARGDGAVPRRHQCAGGACRAGLGPGLDHARDARRRPACGHGDLFGGREQPGGHVAAGHPGGQSRDAGVHHRVEPGGGPRGRERDLLRFLRDPGVGAHRLRRVPEQRSRLRGGTAGERCRHALHRGACRGLEHGPGRVFGGRQLRAGALGGRRDPHRAAGSGGRRRRRRHSQRRGAGRGPRPAREGQRHLLAARASSRCRCTATSSGARATRPGSRDGPASSRAARGAGTQVIDAFLPSPEFAGFVAPVVRLYFATFLRVPDYDGLAYNAGLVRAGTVTPVQLADFFAASPEFAATYGALDDAAFVTLLYNNVLGRAPDPAGLAGWVALLRRHEPRAGAVSASRKAPSTRPRSRTRCS